MAVRPTILIIGEDQGVSNPVRTLGFRPVLVGEPQEAIVKAKSAPPSLVVINLPGPAIQPRFLHELSKEGTPILILADPETAPASASLEEANVQVLTRPVEDANLLAILLETLNGNGVITSGRGARREPVPPDRYLAEYVPLFHHSPLMRAIREMIERVANTTATVLIRGESGAGKELVARAIHAASARHDQSFVKVNCAALPAELLESELFGHERGAFTGAYRRKLGKFEFAHKGTLFLDEIGELPPALQAKLLHVLQDHEFFRLGGRETVRVDARVIASTNRDLEAGISAGQFREDLYYRLNVVEIHVPPLRERTEEIPALVTRFLHKFQREYGREARLPPDALTCFAAYKWPGNVRELENIVRRLVVLGQQGQEDILSGLKNNRAQPARPAPDADASPPTEERAMGLREIARRAAREAERRAIQEVLDRVRWNRTQAARFLQISYKTLLSKIAECGLDPKPRRPGS